MKRTGAKLLETAKRRITIVLADDHPLFLHGLRDVLQQQHDYEIVAEAADGEQALRVIEQFRPAIAVLDIDMPKMTGLAVAREIAKRKLDTEVIMLTMHEDAEHFDQAMDAGARGYVVKDNAVVDILKCIESIVDGKSYVTPTLTRHLLDKHEPSKRAREEKLGIAGLTASERKVLKLISQSKSTKQIAAQLSISERTVSAHRFNICAKLNLHGTNALLRFALENKATL